MQVSVSPRRFELQCEVQRCQESLEKLEEVANYSRDRDWFEPALKKAEQKRTISGALTAAGVAGIAVGLAVPALGMAAPVGLVVALYAGLAFKSAGKERAWVREAKEENTRTIAMFDQHISMARGRLNEARQQLAGEEDEPAEVVQKMVQGLRQSTRVLEDSVRVTFAGVSLKKRNASLAG